MMSDFVLVFCFEFATVCNDVAEVGLFIRQLVHLTVVISV